jgi:hypothetical protein
VTYLNHTEKSSDSDICIFYLHFNGLCIISEIGEHLREGGHLGLLMDMMTVKNYIKHTCHQSYGTGKLFIPSK